MRERFGGNEARFRAANPLDILATRRFPHSAALVAVGAQDAYFGWQADQLAAGMLAAGFEVRRATAPGGHSWVVWQAVLSQELPWLAARLNLVAVPAASPAQIR